MRLAFTARGKTAAILVASLFFLGLVAILLIAVSRHPVLRKDNASLGRFTSALPPAGVRLVSQRRIPSDDPYYPVAVELVFKTDQPIQPLAFVIQADRDIGMGRALFRGEGEYRLYTHTKQGIPSGHPNWFAFEWDSPSFTSQESLVVTVFAHEQLQILQINRVPYEWP